MLHETVDAIREKEGKSVDALFRDIFRAEPMWEGGELGEAVDDKYNCDDEHGNQNGHKGENRNARDGGIAKADSVVVHIPKNTKPVPGPGSW